MNNSDCDGRSRRKPQQQRAKDRVNHIVATFTQLLTEKGLTGVTMHEIGMKTGGPIASVYQYFPDKSSILEAACAPFFQLTNDVMRGVARKIRTQQDALTAVGRYSEEFAVSAVNLQQTFALQAAKKADKRVASIDLAVKMQNADILLAAASRYLQRDQALNYRRAVLLLLNFFDDRIATVLECEPSAATLMMEDYKRFADSSLQVFRS